MMIWNGWKGTHIVHYTCHMVLDTWALDKNRWVGKGMNGYREVFPNLVFI